MVSHHQPVEAEQQRSFEDWFKSVTFTTPWLQREHARRANLLDLRADEDSSDGEHWNAAQRRVDARARSRARCRPKPSPKSKHVRAKKQFTSLLPPSTAPGLFPTEVETAYLASVRLPHGTSLLVDTGSPNNITSSEWTKYHSRELRAAGLPDPSYEHRGTWPTLSVLAVDASTDMWRPSCRMPERQHCWARGR